MTTKKILSLMISLFAISWYDWALEYQEYQVLSDLNYCSIEDPKGGALDGQPELKIEFNEQIIPSDELCDVSPLMLGTYKANDFILDYSKNTLHLKEKECSSKNVFTIFRVEESILNDKQRFSNWWQGHPDTKKLWGLYDSQTFPNHPVIIVTRQDKDDFETTLVHELAHYWYDRFCFQNQISLDTEQYARLIQEAYKLRQTNESK